MFLPIISVLLSFSQQFNSFDKSLSFGQKIFYTTGISESVCFIVTDVSLIEQIRKSCPMLYA